jgi:hypothetical protein
MLQQIIIRFWNPTRPLPFTLDLDRLPAIALGRHPPERPVCEDATIYYHCEEKFSFIGFLDFVRVSDAEVRYRDGPGHPPIDPEAHRRFDAFPEDMEGMIRDLVRRRTGKEWPADFIQAATPQGGNQAPATPGASGASNPAATPQGGGQTPGDQAPTALDALVEETAAKLTRYQANYIRFLAREGWQPTLGMWQVTLEVIVKDFNHRSIEEKNRREKNLRSARRFAERFCKILVRDGHRLRLDVHQCAVRMYPANINE